MVQPPTCAVEGGVYRADPAEGIRGKLTCKAPLAPYTWFKTGGLADWLFEPADLEDLRAFLERLGGEIPVMALGLGSNMIIRDGGVPGVVVRLGKAFAGVELTGENELTLRRGGERHSGRLHRARLRGIAGLEFLRGIPGTVGGFVRMNGGAYGREVCRCAGRLRGDPARRRVRDADRCRTRLRLSPLGFARGRDCRLRTVSRPPRRSGSNRRRDGSHRRRARSQPAAAHQDRGFDIQEPGRATRRGSWSMLPVAGASHSAGRR